MAKECRKYGSSLVWRPRSPAGAHVGSVAKHVDGNGPRLIRPVLHTGVPPEKEENLKKLHALCDWVVTLDRNAGVEYFDSPRDNPAIYEAYVISSPITSISTGGWRRSSTRFVSSTSTAWDSIP